MEKNLSRRNVMVGAVASAAAFTLSSANVQAAEPVVHDVRIKRFKFSPRQLEVSVGDTIRWTNEDLAPHTATANEFGWDTKEIIKGASAEIEVSEGMETEYFCVFHPNMKATIVIKSD
ncbi:amicyanin [Phaeobacter inhibens]|uniref:cupredoxin domain-containing protein n=1 Tax=Phaeobacter inhibens TaxID=221822 RepID=UPI002761D8C1|nr:cupredoxin domain-containing protein [Phaeobacter inhibens]GLO69095.1 amicyanin [Phaeobacter inhibens]